MFLFETLDFYPGKIKFNEFTFSAETALENLEYDLNQDMFLVSYHNGKLMIDLGWYGSLDKGEFIFRVIEDQNWDKPLIEIRTPLLKELYPNMQKCINHVKEIREREQFS